MENFFSEVSSFGCGLISSIDYFQFMRSARKLGTLGRVADALREAVSRDAESVSALGADYNLTIFSFIT